MLKKIKNISKQSLTIALGIVLGAAISIYATYTPWNDTSFLQTAINENRVLKPNEIQKIKDNLDYLKSHDFSYFFECVTGWASDSNNYGINKSSLGYSYPYDYAFGFSRFKETDGRYYVGQWCKNGWVMTGCSADTPDYNRGDNDEKMIGQNTCFSDQMGTNIVYTRCCRIVGLSR